MAEIKRRRYCPRCDTHHYGGEHTASKTCPACGKDFMPPDWRADFCSRRCSKLKDLPSKTCERCGKSFRKDPDWSLAHWSRRRFCSLPCRGSGRPRTYRTCAYCDTRFWTDHGTRPKYCGQACYFLSLRTERYPVNRRPRRLAEFTHAQKTKLRNRAGNRCQRCGATKHLEADHIIPVWNDGTNAISNGQVLCRPCHRDKTQADVQNYWRLQTF